jgi:hypothetical protein
MGVASVGERYPGAVGYIIGCRELCLSEIRPVGGWPGLVDRLAGVTPQKRPTRPNVSWR